MMNLNFRGESIKSAHLSEAGMASGSNFWAEGDEKDEVRE